MGPTGQVAAPAVTAAATSLYALLRVLVVLVLGQFPHASWLPNWKTWQKCGTNTRAAGVKGDTHDCCWRITAQRSCLHYVMGKMTG
jgi:hypothetical protein